MLIVFIYAYLCQTQFPFHLMFVSFNSKTTGATRGAEIAYLSGSPEITSVIFSGVLVVHSLFCCVVFCRPLFVFFGHCIVCTSRIYDFRLSRCYFHFSYDVFLKMFEKKLYILFNIMYVFRWNKRKYSVWYKMLFITTLWWLKNGAAFHEIFELLCHDVIALKCGGRHQCKQRKQRTV